MKYWALLVVILYMLMLAAISWPLVLLLLPPSTELQFPKTYGNGFYWSVVGVFALAQAALLLVPVRVADQRPVPRRSLLLPMAATGFMAALLCLGALLTLFEIMPPRYYPAENHWADWVLEACGVVWLFWTVVFYRLSRGQDARDVVTRLCRTLLRGSILELLVAVPSHIIVRSRNECCAGGMTFFGITLGFSVMVFSYGPGIFFLFADRWKKLHPRMKDG
jgi:hypothetical protein